VLALVQGAVHGQSASLEDLERNIPILSNKFYVDTLARWVVYADVFVLVIGIGMMVIGQGAGGDRVEAAGMYAKGKKMVIGALILLPILAALPEIVKFLLAAGTPSSSTSGLANDVPTWG